MVLSESELSYSVTYTSLAKKLNVGSIESILKLIEEKWLEGRKMRPAW